MPSICLAAVRLHAPALLEVVSVSRIVRRRSGLNLHAPFDRDVADLHQVEARTASVSRLYEGVEDRSRTNLVGRNECRQTAVVLIQALPRLVFKVGIELL